MFAGSLSAANQDAGGGISELGLLKLKIARIHQMREEKAGQLQSIRDSGPDNRSLGDYLDQEELSLQQKRMSLVLVKLREAHSDILEIADDLAGVDSKIIEIENRLKDREWTQAVSSGAIEDASRSLYRLREKRQGLLDEFKATQEDIAEFKTQIDEARSRINLLAPPVQIDLNLAQK